MSSTNRFFLTGTSALALAFIGFSSIAFTGAETNNEGTTDEFQFTIEMLDQMPGLPGELGALPTSIDSKENPTTPEKIELGNMLFFDTRLSRDHSMSCATCHDPAKGWADGRPLAQGFGGMTLGRHSPTVINAAFNSAQFWDGRAPDLEAQAVGPIMAAGEMNSASEEELIKRLSASKDYRDRFQKVFGGPPTLASVGKAIAAFERTIVSTDSRFDAYCRGDKSALNDSEKRGLILFFGKASCTQCHSGPNFSDNKYHNLGGHHTGATKDEGRYAISKDEKERGAFKTATCRSVTLTGPYMHDGRLATLEDVVDYYNVGGGKDPNKSELVQPLHLTDKEKADLVAFLKSLTGSVPGVTALTAVDDAKVNE